MHRALKKGVTAIKKVKLILAALAVIAVIGVLIYFHIFWWLLLGIIALIVILLHFSVRVYVEASRAKGIDIRAKYLFFTVYPRPKKTEKQKEQAPPEEDFGIDLDEDLEEDFDEDDDLDDIPDDELPDLPDELSEEAEDDEASDETDPEAVDEKLPSDPLRKDKKQRKKDKKDKSPDSDDGEKEEKQKGGLAAIRAKFDRIRPYIPLGWKAVKKFCKAIRFDGVFARVDVGRFDAHEAAIYYGAVQGVLFNALGWLANIFTVRVKKADVNCHFNENVIDGEVSFTVKVRPSTLIAIAFCTGVNFLIIFIKQRRARKKQAEAEPQAPETAEAA